MFQGDERPYEHFFSMLRIEKMIIWRLDVLKNDFGEFNEEMFQDVERPCELIFFIQGIVKKQLGQITLSDDLRRRIVMRTQSALWKS
jgi:hypothetical protein